MDDHAADDAARWAHAPLEETLDGARQLTVTVADACMRGMWEAIAVEAAIPKRRWRRHHPAPTGRAVIAAIDGRPALDMAAWSRLVSLVPGAVALPTRTADEFDVPRGELRPPARAVRALDLWGARRRRARMRRRERTLDSDLATFQATLEATLDAALAPGDDGTPLAGLPTYALASRFDELLRSTGSWDVPVAIDLAAAHATSTLLRLLAEAGRSPGAALLEAATLQSGGGAPVDRHLHELGDIAAAPAEQRERLLAEWRDSLHGWHAARSLLLEAPPLRMQPGVIRSLLAEAHAPIRTTEPPSVDHLDDPLQDAALRARHLTALREQVARDRGDLHAALRALAWTLGAALHAAGSLDTADQVFDLPVVDLLRLARGVEVEPRPAPAVVDRPGTRSSAKPPPLPAELRGIPASPGIADGAVVVLDDPDLGTDVEGAIVVCRVTDPAWLPLMMRCAGLVAERGGPLSHAAIVARELGLPAVVGASGAVATARTATRGQVDGSTGVVRLAHDA